MTRMVQMSNTREEQIKQDQESIYQGGFEQTVNTGV